MARIPPARSPSTTFSLKNASFLKSIVVCAIYHFCAALTENIAMQLRLLFSLHFICNHVVPGRQLIIRKVCENHFICSINQFYIPLTEKITQRLRLLFSFNSLSVIHLLHKNASVYLNFEIFNTSSKMTIGC